MRAQRQIGGMTTRARVLDRLGRHLIAVGGISIIAAVLGIFVFILREAYPLFGDPEVKREEQHLLESQGSAFAAGLDPHQEMAWVAETGGVAFVELAGGRLLRAAWPENLRGVQATSAAAAGDGLALGLEDGRALIARIGFEREYAGDRPQVRPFFAILDTLILESRREPIVRIALGGEINGRLALAGIARSGRLWVALREQSTGLLVPGPVTQQVYELSGELSGGPQSLLIDGQARQLLVGTDQGEIGEWELGGVNQRPIYRGSFVASERGNAIAALAFVLGDISVVVGDAAGQVSTWFKVQEGEQQSYRQIHRFKSHSLSVSQIAPSRRDKQFLTADVGGEVALHHLTSAQTFFQVSSGIARLAALAFAPKADGFAVLGSDRQLVSYRLENPHPDVTLSVLFRRVWYEGYPKPEYVWQSTGGTDEFESKMSLVPLIFGTAKGTFYAMLFALPLSVLAAIYTAEFASPRVRALVKPTVEVMASLPSVILGFLAGLWLAPLLEGRAFETLLLFPTIPMVVILAAWTWHQLPQSLARRLALRGEIYLLLALSLAAVGLAFVLGPWVEGRLFREGFLAWLAQRGVRYDQRNCLVVGLAMGFAVIPLIFTLCEDALSAVPRHLRAASLALGATRWQTTLRVILPMALPGIFSAAMVGLGRAIGETMIVLMATGNTPIMEWSLFTGMRTISANIAVELPEAPYHSSLYRVLFLSGLLLFVATFCFNTLAELVRQRLRDRYTRL